MTKATTKTPIQTFMKPVQPDAVLAVFVGSDPLPRTEITKKLWAYIKAHRLQDTKDRRQINANGLAAVRDLFGGKDSVSMFELTKCIAAHIVP